jgi:hypothetical protein
MRLVLVKIKPRVSKGKYKGGSSGVDSDGILRIATNLLDVPAEISSRRNHRTPLCLPLDHRDLLPPVHAPARVPPPAELQPDGIEIQSYCAIIACLVIALWTGRQPTKPTHEMLCFHMLGWATTDEMEAHLAKLKLADAQAAKKL